MRPVEDFVAAHVLPYYANSHTEASFCGAYTTGLREEARAEIARLTGASGDDFRRAWGERLLPALDAFQPDLIVISAGFDAHRADPVGGLRLIEDDFDWATREILAIARARAKGRVVSVLEGGYDLSALASSAAAHVECLMRA